MAKPRATQDAKKPVGRPSKFDVRFCRIATDLARAGRTNEQMAKSFGVATATFSNWMVAHPEFLDAVKEGREVADNLVAKALFDRACGYSHEAVRIFVDKGTPVIVPYIERYPPDPVSCIFWLKNRMPENWRNAPSPEDNETQPTPVKIEVNVVDGRKALADS